MEIPRLARMRLPGEEDVAATGAVVPEAVESQMAEGAEHHTEAEPVPVAGAVGTTMKPPP